MIRIFSETMDDLEEVLFRDWLRRDKETPDYHTWYEMEEDTRKELEDWVVLPQLIYSHPYHLVEPSSYPFIVSFFSFFLAFSFVNYISVGTSSLWFIGFIVSLVIIFACLLAWGLQVVKESAYGFHNERVRRGLRIGFALFIVSEVMFFFGFFWAFFHSSLSPSIWIGATWPPLGIIPLYPYSFPLLNTFLLLLSGYTLTYTHNQILFRNIHLSFLYLNLRNVKDGFSYTLLYAITFLAVQNL